MDIEVALSKLLDEEKYGEYAYDRERARAGFLAALDAKITEAVKAALATKETESP